MTNVDGYLWEKFWNGFIEFYHFMKKEKTQLKAKQLKQNISNQ